MKNDQEKRLIKLLVIACFIILGLLSIIVAEIFVELGNVQKKQLTLIDVINGIHIKNGVDGELGPQGVQGVQGIQGVQGAQGPQGKKGDAGITSQGPIGPQGVQGAQGPKGDTGEAGAPGKTVFTRQNLLTGEYECRYSGDTEWQPESECI